MERSRLQQAPSPQNLIVLHQPRNGGLAAALRPGPSGQWQPSLDTVTTLQLVQSPNLAVHAFFLIDVSSSMSTDAGNRRSRLDVVLELVKQTVALLCPSDRVTMACFNTRYHQVRGTYMRPR